MLHCKRRLGAPIWSRAWRKAMMRGIRHVTRHGLSRPPRLHAQLESRGELRRIALPVDPNWK
jgi:hypothetical protein